MTLSDIQRKACESVLHDAEAGRRERGLKIAQQPHLLDLKPSENGNILVRFTYEQAFNLTLRKIEEMSYSVIIMGSGNTACDCGDSTGRQVICKHACVVSALLLTEHRQATEKG